MADSGRAPSRYLIDTSVWARQAGSPAVVAALSELVTSTRPSGLLICPPLAVEYGYGARTGADHSRLVDDLLAFTPCRVHPSVEEALRIQNELWNNGLLRSVGAIDTLVAAYAMANDATLVHYDGDFEHIAAVAPGLRHRWIVERGSVD